MFRKPVLALLAASAIVAGCASVEPPLNLNEQLEYTDTIASLYPIDERWWLVYNDTQLNSLIEQALENNIDLARAAISINRALYQANLLGQDLLPAFSGGYDVSARKNIRTGDPSVRSFGGDVSISYEVDLWGRLADAVSAQEWEYQATREDREAVRLALINNVIDAYYHYNYLSNGIDIMRQYIANYTEIRRVTEAKYEAGKVASVEPAQARQSLLQAQNTLIDLETSLKTVEQTLRDLLNLKPADTLAITPIRLLDCVFTPVNLDVPLSVLANRPDLKAAEYRLLGAYRDVKAAEKSWLPSITLGGAIGSSSERARTSFDAPFVSGLISIDLPFLQWNRIRWNIRLSEADYELIRLDMIQALTTALNEVDTYYYLYARSRDTMSNTDSKLQEDIRIRNYYRIRYENGADELIDWLNAINTTLNSELNSLENRYQVVRYENMLYKAMAGRYVPQAANLPPPQSTAPGS